MEESTRDGYLAGISSLIMAVITGIAANSSGWLSNTGGQVSTFLMILFGAFSIGSFIKPDSVGQVVMEFLRRVSRSSSQDSSGGVDRSKNKVTQTYNVYGGSVSTSIGDGSSASSKVLSSQELGGKAKKSEKPSGGKMSVDARDEERLEKIAKKIGIIEDELTELDREYENAERDGEDDEVLDEINEDIENAGKKLVRAWDEAAHYYKTNQVPRENFQVILKNSFQEFIEESELDELFTDNIDWLAQEIL
ncbi:MAG: hypothetical protein AB1529_01765 [Candidatus Micrarchaeota archaeon]